MNTLEQVIHHRDLLGAASIGFGLGMDMSDGRGGADQSGGARVFLGQTLIEDAIAAADLGLACQPVDSEHVASAQALLHEAFDVRKGIGGIADRR
jgi:hypothetical protein